MRQHVKRLPGRAHQLSSLTLSFGFSLPGIWFSCVENYVFIVICDCFCLMTLSHPYLGSSEFWHKHIWGGVCQLPSVWKIIPSLLNMKPWEFMRVLQYDPHQIYVPFSFAAFTKTSCSLSHALQRMHAFGEQWLGIPTSPFYAFLA